MLFIDVFHGRISIRTSVNSNFSMKFTELLYWLNNQSTQIDQLVQLNSKKNEFFQRYNLMHEDENTEKYWNNDMKNKSILQKKKNKKANQVL